MACEAASIAAEVLPRSDGFAVARVAVDGGGWRPADGAEREGLGEHGAGWGRWLLPSPGHVTREIVDVLEADSVSWGAAGRPLR